MIAQTMMTEPLCAMHRWASKQPDAIAALDHHSSLTYRELSNRVDELADRLARRHGGRPDMVVAIEHGQRVETLVALLAVWQLRGTAVMLDPRHPEARRHFAISDSGATLLLGVDGPDSVEAVLADDTATSTADPGLGCAYIIYTSGTTGQPKGVKVSYRGLDTLAAALTTLGLTPGGLALNAVSSAFDGWLWCSLLGLMNGQGVALLDLSAPDEHFDPIALLRTIRTVSMTPTMLATYLDDIAAAEIVVTAGEECPPGLAEELLDHCRVLNVYGPTEATIAATWADSEAGDDVTTIGRPLPGYRAYVLDEQCREVAPGTLGELCIAGPAVALGYVNRDELTNERFMPDVLNPRERMFRTGDRVRQLYDGCFEFHGRQDDQIKVRGHRIELGEIERVATGVDGVAAAACVVDEELSAIDLAVVLAGAMADRVRAACAEKLPPASVPRFVLQVDTLPTLPSGKVDRSALAAKLKSLATDEMPLEQPHDPRLAEVIMLWEKHLGRPVKDPRQGFFESGGHSLAAAKLVADLRVDSGFPLSMVQFLAEPTPVAVATILDQARQTKGVDG